MTPPVASATSAPAAPPALAPVSAPPTPGLFDHQAISPTPSVADIKAPESTPTSSERIYANQYKTPEELEKAYIQKEIAYKESSTEGLRLFQETRLANQQIAELRSKLTELEERAKSPIAPFREMSKEQLDKLWQEDPVKAAEYIADKKLYERDSAQAQEKNKAQREASEKQKAAIEAHILERGRILSSDPKIYPKFNEKIEEMQSIANKIGDDFRGKPWAPDILYFVSLGREYYQSLLKGAQTTAEAGKKTAAGASAVATVTAPAGTAPTEVDKGVDPDSDQAVMQSILKAGNPMLFKV